MRIAIWHNLPSGGGKRALYNQVRGLVARGHYLECWCPPTANRDYLPLGELIQEHVVPVDLPVRSPRTSLEHMAARRNRIVRTMLAMHEHSRLCARQINAVGFDVLLAHPCREMAASFIGLYVRGPKALYLAEPNRALYEAMPVLPWAALPAWTGPTFSLRRLLRWFKDRHNLPQLRQQVSEEARAAAAYDNILVNSLFSRESVLRVYGLDSRVCYLGVDTGLFRPLNLARERFAVMVGSFTRAKGADTLIGAMSCLPEPRPPLVWVANLEDPVFRRAMEREARDLGVDLQIRLNIADVEVVRLLNQATVMLYAARLEPFGFAPLEANACGTPVVAVAEGGVRETVRNDFNGLAVDRDPEQLAAATLKIFADPNLGHRLGRTGQEWVEQTWTVEQSVDRIESMLQDVTQRAPAEKASHFT